MYFVDTCVIVDLQMPDTPWHEWARVAVRRSALSGLAINHIVLAELFSSREPARVQTQLALFDFEIDPLDAAITARAGKAQRLYRDRGGPRAAIITDFLIGAHAAVRGWPLITRDRQRFAGYFPELVLVAPEDRP